MTVIREYVPGFTRVLRSSVSLVSQHLEISTVGESFIYRFMRCVLRHLRRCIALLIVIGLLLPLGFGSTRTNGFKRKAGEKCSCCSKLTNCCRGPKSLHCGGTAVSKGSGCQAGCDPALAVAGTIILLGCSRSIFSTFGSVTSCLRRLTCPSVP